jgi:hypothetical protein
MRKLPESERSRDLTSNLTQGEVNDFALKILEGPLPTNGKWKR